MIYKNEKVDEIRKYTDRNEYQRPIFGEVWNDVGCRWTERLEIVFDNENRKVESNVQVVFEPDIDRLPPLSEIDKGGNTYIVIKSHLIPGISTIRGVKVFLTGGKKNV